jgi:hypothetical protein
MGYFEHVENGTLEYAQVRDGKPGKHHQRLAASDNWREISAEQFAKKHEARMKKAQANGDEATITLPDDVGTATDEGSVRVQTEDEAASKKKTSRRRS